MRNRLFFALLPAYFGLCAVVMLYRPGTESLPGYHQHVFTAAMRVMADSLPDFENQWFATAGRCDHCHGEDPAQLAMVDANGNDVNPVDDWASTMMANSAKDPFWRAQVSHEVTTNPGHQTVLEDKCTSCHAPLGRYSHYFSTGQGNYSIAQLENDTLGLDGVTCLACHSTRTDSLGLAFSGKLLLDTTKIVNGPYPGPLGSPMVAGIGFTPVYGPHIGLSETCANCHTLITETVDLQGAPTGDHFPEQATYHEWLNSVYSTNGTRCQTCHVPQITGGIKISSYPSVIPPRSPYGKHHFVGANTFMLRMLKAYRDSLDIGADAEAFDSTIARTNAILRNETLAMQLTELSRDPDTVRYALRLTNRAGHKFPSGYPSRRAYVEFVVRDNMGDTLFQSGILGNDYELVGQDSLYEPHYDIIRSEDEVQVYEMIMGDVNGDVTTTLERAKNALKDNRLPPEGFLTTHSAYDTCVIAGAALTDADFNKAGATEGTGADIVHYNVALNGYIDSLQVSARVYYQTVRPGWLDEMFAHNTTEIDRFRNWYQASDRSTVLVGELLSDDVLGDIDAPQPALVTIYPNPTTNGLLFAELPEGIAIDRIAVFAPDGKLIREIHPGPQRLHSLQLPAARGMYLIVVEGDGRREVKKAVY